ncbi:MAG: PEP-CTERM sorting domain-containing protein, partial [Phycisphaerae bacterium]|nr:PEP-CTERM sorting domain-containing protein [Phycisphaerae bacterium]
NTNTAGIPGRPNPILPGAQLTATTGIEMRLSAQLLDADPGQAPKVMFYVTSGSGDFASNQFLPGLPGDTDNLGFPGGIGGDPMYDARFFEAIDPTYRCFLTLALPEWAAVANNNASLDSNWNHANPDGKNTTAVFGTLGLLQRNVNMNPRTLGGIVFRTNVVVPEATTTGYTLNGGTITLDTYGRAARLIASSADHVINAPVVVNQNLVMDVAPGAQLDVNDVSNAPGISVTKVGGGRGLLNKLRGLASLSVQGGRLQIDAASSTNSLTIADGPSAPSAVLDVKKTGLVVDYTGPSPFADIRSLILAGRAGGNWGGNGITSSSAAANSTITAVGYAEASSLGLSSFLGLPVDSDAVVLRYTRMGDANLNGTTELGDFAILGANFNGQGTVWGRGDFNFDGDTNLGDFALLAANFNQSAPGDLPRAAVPEPAALGLLAVSAGLMLRRRRIG